MPGLHHRLPSLRFALRHVVRKDWAGIAPRTVEDRNILFVTLDGVCVGFATAAGAFLSVFVIRLGADAFWVSLLSSLPALIHLLLTLPLSRLVAAQKRIVPFFARGRLLARTYHIVIGVLPFFLRDERAAKAIVLLYAASAVVTTVQQLGFTLVMNRAVSRGRRAVMMSRRWTALGVAEIIVLAIAGQVLERLPFPLNYQVVFLASFTADLLGYYTINQVQTRDENSPSSSHLATSAGDRKGPFWARMRSGAIEVLQQRPFVRFALARNAYWLGISMIGPLVPIYWVENLRASDAWVSYFNTALSATTLFSYGVWVRIKRARGNRFVLLVSVLGRSFYPLLVSLTPTPLAMLLLSALNGIWLAGMNLMFFDAFLDTVPTGQEARFIAVNQTLTSIIGFVGPPMGAALLPFLGMRLTLASGTLVASVGFLLFLLGGVARESADEASASHQANEMLSS